MIDCAMTFMIIGVGIFVGMAGLFLAASTGFLLIRLLKGKNPLTGEPL